MKVSILGKLIAVAMWADEKVTPEEWTKALSLHNKYGVNEDELQQSIATELEELQKDCETEEAELNIQPIDTSEIDCDIVELLSDIFQIYTADKVVNIPEISMAHIMGEMLKTPPEVITIALLDAITKADCKIEITTSQNEED